MTVLLIALAALFFWGAPAEAGPVAAAIGAAVKAIAAWKIGTFSIGLFLLKQTVAFSLSLLARKKAKAGSTGGIRSEQTMSGEGTSGSIILGKIRNRRHDGCAADDGRQLWQDTECGSDLCHRSCGYAHHQPGWALG